VYCDPHRARLGKLIPAQYSVGDENFCVACFSGEPRAESEEEILLPAAARKHRSATYARSHLTREELLRLLARAKRARERDWTLFLVTFWHGLRPSQAISLTPEHFAGEFLDLPDGLRTVQPLVSDANALLDETAGVAALLQAHRDAHAGDGAGRRLFPISRVQFYRLMHRYGLEAGLPKHLCHPRALKRSIALQLLLEGGIQKAHAHLGHRSILSTCAYLLH
jgi:integrase